MVITVTPNTAIDKTYTVEGFGLDHVHRPSASRTVAGGKGINVVRVLKTLGIDGLATGFVGGAIGDAVLRLIYEEGLPHDFVRVRDESRLCIAVVDPQNGTQTEINENGPEISPDELEMMLGKAGSLMAGREYMVLCGSCPPGVPTSFYGDIIRMAKCAGLKTVLDTSNDHLRESVKAAPYMVKPNVTELSQLVGRELLTLEEIVRAAKSLKGHYEVNITAVTMGRSGAIVTDGERVWKAVPPEIQFASAVGSGDAFLAMFIASMINGESIQDALVSGTAAGAANATTFGAGFCSKECIMDIRRAVTLTEIS
ncbi:MAG: 1-phosphofructokinase [Armatimonadota bacterium]|nr:1-phosphofructokinase [bacterium]